MRFAAVGFTCIDVYKNLNISYPTGNGIDLMFNLMDLVPELVPSVVTAIGDDAYGQSMLEACLPETMRHLQKYYIPLR